MEVLGNLGEELQMLDMGWYAEEWKFSFNASKSKTVVVGATSGSERWMINWKKMEAKAFKYLGAVLPTGGGATGAVCTGTQCKGAPKQCRTCSEKICSSVTFQSSLFKGLVLLYF